jgi:hypothetical protein
MVDKFFTDCGIFYTAKLSKSVKIYSHAFFGQKIRKGQNGLDQKEDVLEKIIIRDFFSKLNVESTKNTNFKIPNSVRASVGKIDSVRY